MGATDLTPGPGEITALLGAGTEFRGKLVFEGRARVDGALRGEVHGAGMLVVGEGADIDADIDVDALLVLGGIVRGRVRARELVELHAPSHVIADLETPRLFVDKGARFDGRCQMSDGASVEPLPMDEEPVERSAAPAVVAPVEPLQMDEPSDRSAAPAGVADAPAADAPPADAPVAETDAPVADV